MPSSNYWDSTYGRGIGGPYAGTSPPPQSAPQSSSYTSYVPPSAGTQQAQNSTSNMSASDYFDWARFAYGVYRDRNPPKPQFENVPLSPEQKQMYQIYIQSMLNPATVNNAAALNQMASQMMGGLSKMKWESPRTFSGDTGYSGSNMSFTPPQFGGAGGSWPVPGGSGGSPTPSTIPPGSGYGGPSGFGGTHQPLPPAPTGASGGMPSFFSRYAGSWNANEETYEKWLARAAAIAAGALGFPIPASMIDKGIDAAQWVYRKATGRDNAQPLPQPTRGVADVYKNAPGTEYTEPLPQPTRGVEDVYKNAPGTRDQYGNPPPPPPGQRPPAPQDYWSGNKTPYWNDPYRANDQMPFQWPGGVYRPGRQNRM